MSMDRMRRMELEQNLMSEIVRRRALGEYNPDAKSILLIMETLYELVRLAAPKTRKPGHGE